MRTGNCTTIAADEREKPFTKPLVLGLAFISMGFAAPTSASVAADAIMARGTITSPSSLPMPIDRPRGSINFKSVASAIAAIRRKTGLRIEDIGLIFDVSRKTVHNWSNGKTATQDNEMSIYRVAGMFERTHATPEQIRALLGTTTSDGELLFDKLCQGKFDEVSAVLNVRTMNQPAPGKHIFDTRDRYIPAGFLAETETPLNISGGQKLKAIQPIAIKRG